MTTFWAVCSDKGAICMDANDQALIFSLKRNAKDAGEIYAGANSEIVRIDKVEII
jgi:hypothetical protein